jgi:hypothetical protein
MTYRRSCQSGACSSRGLIAVAVVFAGLLATPATAAAQPAAGPRAGLVTARVVFCGDSITGQGGGCHSLLRQKARHADQSGASLDLRMRAS